MNDTVWALINAFGPREGKVAAGPFDSYADAAGYDPDDDRLEARPMTRGEWDRRAG